MDLEYKATKMRGRVKKVKDEVWWRVENSRKKEAWERIKIGLLVRAKKKWKQLQRLEKQVESMNNIF